MSSTQTLQTPDILLTLLRLSPVLTSTTGFTLSAAFGLFFLGFRQPSIPAAAKWAVMPTWLRSARNTALRAIFATYNCSIVLGGINASGLYWSPSSSPLSTTSPATGQHWSWSRGAYLLGTVFSISYYLYTIYVKAVPLNIILVDDKASAERRADAEVLLAELDKRRTLLTSAPMVVSFFGAAALWILGI